MFIGFANLNKLFEHIIEHMFIGFVNLNKHFEHVMLIVSFRWVCQFGQTL